MLKVLPVEIYASDSFALLDTRAVPNVTYAELIEQLNLVPKATPKTITIADESNSP